SSSAVVTNISPKVLGSTNRRSPPWLKVSTTCVCGGSDCRLVPRRNCPLIPKWTTSTSPLSRWSSTYLPRRSALVILRPSSREVNSLRLPWRRITRIAFRVGRTSAAWTFRPTTSFSRSRRITSTSGSSTDPSPSALRGALGPQLQVALVRGLLLGLLLGVADPPSVRPAREEDRRGELLLVIRPALADPVLGERVQILRRELLKERLVVASHALLDVGDHEGAEQALDQPPGHVETEIEVDRAEHRLEGVSQDAGLVAPPGHLLSPAEPDVLAEVQVARDVGQRVHVHDGGPELGELALGHLRELAVREVGHHEPEDGIPQELEPLVVHRRALLEG